MSSLGSQWKVIRHYLSMTNLGPEVEKLLQKVKPATAEQWDNLIRRFEKAVQIRLAQPQVTKENEAKETLKVDSLKSSTTDIDSTTNIENQKEKEKLDKPEEKISQTGLTVGSEVKEITIEGFLQGLKLKKDLHFGKISDRSWKSNKPIISKMPSFNEAVIYIQELSLKNLWELPFPIKFKTLQKTTSIHSRTAYVISAIVTAETSECLLKRTEHLIDHLRQYPEARDYAIKEGAVRALLRVQHRLTNDEETLTKEVSGIVKEALALMGYTAPTKGPGPNILAIDGGGIRGIIAIEILRHLERLTGRRVQDMFDYIIGVSTGAIIAAVIGSGVGSLDTANQMYHTLSKKMFGNTSVIGGTSRLVWTHSYYDTDAWEKLLQENLRDCTLAECNRYNTPKLALVSCVVNTGSRLTPFLFRSYECGFRVRSVFPGTSSARVWEAVRASAAAPTYFNEFRLDGLLHQDGGIMVNNPTGVGLHEAKLLFGHDAVKNGTIVSVGTGQALNKHLDYQLLAKGLAKDTSGTSWKDKFNKILDSATDTEGTHLILNDLLPPGNYFRFNPPLMQQCAMDEINPEKLNNLVTDTNAYIRRNQHKFEQAAIMLTRKRGVAQRVLDYVQHRSQLMGVVLNN